MARIDLDAALCGFILPDPRLVDDALRPVGAGVTDSDYTQASPVPGVAVYQRGSIGRTSTTAGDRGPSVRLQVLGEQAADFRSMVTRAGMPGAGCEVAVRRDFGADGEQWQGRATPQIWAQLSAAEIDRGTDGHHNWAGIDLENGQAVVVFNDASVIQARRYDLASHDWAAAAVTVADHTRAMDADGAQPGGAAYTSGHPVDVLRLPTGRLLVAALVLGPGGGVDLVIHYSDDDALTWRSLTLAGYDVELPVGAVYDSISWAYTHESVLLLVGMSWTDEQTPHRGWVQYASSDLGHSFSLVESWNDGASTADVWRPDIAATIDGVFVVAGMRDDGGGNRTLQIRRIASAYLPLRDADAVAVQSGLVMLDDVSIWTDSTGAVYVAWAALERLHVARSLDGGASWASLTTGLTRLPTSAIDRFRAIPIGSRILWTLADTLNGARPDQWLALVESGGWSMVPPSRVAAGHPYELRGFGSTVGGLDSITWLPLSRPDNYGWTLTGTAAAVSGSGAWRLPLSATTEYARALGSHSVETGIVVHFEAATTTSPVGYASQAIGVEVDLGNGTIDQRIDVRLTNAGVAVYDVNGAALIGSAAVDCTVRRVYRVALGYAGSGHTVALYSRPASGEVWALHVAGTATRRTSGGGTTAVRWGHLAAGSWVSTWYAVCAAVGDGYGSHTATTDSLSAGLVISQAPDTLPGAPLPAYPARLHVEAGAYLRGRGGPGARGDYWAHPRAYLYPVGDLLTRSPSREHRTVGDGVAMHFTYEPRAGVEHHPGGHAVAASVFGANYRAARLQGGDGATWVDLAALDLAEGLVGLSYARTGDTIRVAAGAVAAYLRPLDLIGGTVAIGAARYVIVSATPGVWRHGSATVTLQVSGAPAGTASGTLDIWRPGGAVVALGMTTAYRYWRWQIDAQTTATGDYRTGRLVVGRVAVLGQRWSRGRQTTYAAQVQLDELPGAVSARKLGDMRRRTVVSWAEGFPTYWGDDPSYQTAGGGPVAMVGDLSPLETLTAQTGGGLSDVVLLPRIVHDPDAGAVEVVQCVGRERAILGYLTGEPMVEDIDGDEASDAVQRLASVEHVEVV